MQLTYVYDVKTTTEPVHMINQETGAARCRELTPEVGRWLCTGDFPAGRKICTRCAQIEADMRGPDTRRQ